MSGVKILAVILTVILAYYWQRSSPKDPLLVETNSGPLKGQLGLSRDGREFYEWLGIPYAKAPIGNLRFMSPVPPNPWKDVLVASKYGSDCIQLDFFYTGLEKIIGDEDCLFVNVHKPKKTEENELFPVMVFIHGGAFQVGSGTPYGPDYFMDEDVILVTLNYRLNVLGFLSTGDKVIRGNMGLKDQNMALRWVKENIGAFGGDANRITIFGESAGGASVHYQVLSPRSKNVFSKAISQSAVAGLPWGFDTTETAVLLAKNYAKIINCPFQSSQKFLDCLRSKPAIELIQACKEEMQKDFLFNPHLDGNNFSPTAEAVDDSEAFITDTPTNIVKKGKFNRIPWMSGVVSEEGLMTSVAFMREKEIMKDYESRWTENTLRTFDISPSHPNGKEIASKIKALYFPGNVTNDEEKVEQYTKLFSDSLFLYLASNTFSVQRQYAPVYLYYYSYRGAPSLTGPFGGITLEKDYGVCHADELFMQFPTKDFFGTVADKKSEHYEFSKDMVKLWASFAQDESSMEFRGVKLRPQAKSGPLKYVELNHVAKLLDEPFKDRTDALNAMGFSPLI